MMQANNADAHSFTADAELQRPHEHDDPVLASLSMREFQIFCCLAMGTSVTAIAEQLNLSVKTVSTYRTRAYDKLGISSDAELRNYAERRLAMVGGTGIEPVASTV